MAFIIKVQNQFDGIVTIRSNDYMNETKLSNNLSQEILLAIWTNEPELRQYLETQFSTVQGSYAPSFVDPSLIHAYDSGEISHDPTKTNYVSNTVGKLLNEARAKIDSYDSSFIRPGIYPSLHLNFLSGFHNPKFSFTRASIGSYFDKNGVLRYAAVNKPRFAHDPFSKEILGILLEESKTNLLLYSNNIANAIFTKSNVSYAFDTTLAPDLSLATKVIEDNTNSAKNIKNNSANIIASTTYTASFFAKAGERSTLYCQMLNGALFGGVNPTIIVDLSLGIVTSNINCTSSVQILGNGWFRFSWTSTTTTLSGLSGISIFNTSQNSYLGDGVSGYYLFGLQYEQGVTATSYIDTSAVIVTRSADSYTVPSSTVAEAFANFTEGTVIICAQKNDKKSYGTYLKLQSDANNYIVVLNNATGIINAIKNASITTYNVGANITDNTFFTDALSFATNNINSSINGSIDVADNSCLIPAASSIFIAGDVNTIIRYIVFYPKKLSDTYIKYLTSQLITGRNLNSVPAISDLGRAAMISPEAILRTTGRQEFSIHGTGTSESRNIRRPYDFTFEIVDSSGVTTISAQPAGSCTANTDNTLTVNAPVGKTLVYAITPVYDN